MNIHKKLFLLCSTGNVHIPNGIDNRDREENCCREEIVRDEEPVGSLEDTSDVEVTTVEKVVRAEREQRRRHWKVYLYPGVLFCSQTDSHPEHVERFRETSLRLVIFRGVIVHNCCVNRVKN